MKIKQITILAALSLFVGCTTTPQVKAPQAGKNNIGSEQQKKVETLIIRASGDAYVLVKVRSTNEQLYRNTLKEGDSATLELEGTVDVLFTAGEHLVFKWKGEELRPSSTGTAKITLD